MIDVHQRRPADRRLRRRRRAGVLLVLDQPGPCPRALRRGPRPDHQGVDRARTVRVHRQALPLRYVNTWPRPMQQPHPEVWIPGAGSLETMEFVARHRYAYMGIPYFHIYVFDRIVPSLPRGMRGARATRPTRFRRGGWSRSTSPRPTRRPAPSTRSTSGTSCAGCCPASRSSRPATRRCARSRTSSRARAASPSTSRRGRRWSRASTPSSARPTPSPRSSPRTSGRLGTGNLLGLFQLGTLPADLT